MQKIYLSSAYLAPVEYYGLIAQNEACFVDLHDNYVKQTYRNRTEILDPSGKLALTIPIDKFSRNRTSMKDVKVSSHMNWQHTHWNAIVSSYNSSPFFEYYADYFYPLYHKNIQSLYDFNSELNIIVLDLLGLDNKLAETSSYIESVDEDALDLRLAISPKNNYMSDLGISYKPYYQLFSEQTSFTSSLSIIDLLFNMGNESIFTLLNMKFKLKKEI